MILELIGLAVLAVCFWNEIVKWLINLCEAVKEIAHAAEVFAQKVEEAVIKLKYMLYYKEGDNWIEETTARKISENEVPQRIKNAIRKEETNVSNEIEEELRLTL